MCKYFERYIGLNLDHLNECTEIVKKLHLPNPFHVFNDSFLIIVISLLIVFSPSKPLKEDKTLLPSILKLPIEWRESNPLNESNASLSSTSRTSPIELRPFNPLRKSAMGCAQ
ncbi:MAG: hypothetical protein IPH98_16950 [Saprospiraceae bacterium]|nr:hypothetical protein [Candidatus Defluviibacterium haderslevense]